MNDLKRYLPLAILLLTACGPLSANAGGGAGGAAAGAPIPQATVDPNIVGTLPAAGSMTADKTKGVLVSFDAPIDPTSLTPTTLQVYLTEFGPFATLSGIVDYDAITQSIVFTPSQPMQEVTNYTAVLSQGVLSSSGGKLGSAYTWSFTTKDQTPPTVLFTTPQNFAVGVDPFTSVVLNFNEPIDPATLSIKASQNDPGSFLLYNNSGELSVPGSLSYVAGSNQVTFQPTKPLKAVTQYIGNVSFVKDVFGNQMQATYVFNFTVKDYLFATTVSPTDGASNVPTDAALTVLFNHSLNPATINDGSFHVSGGVTTSQPIALSSNNTLATYVPSANLAPFTEYAITLDATIKDGFGNSLVPSVFHFTTGAGPTKWNTASVIDESLNASDAATYQIEQAGNGDTFAIWLKSGIVFANRMPKGGNWETPVAISSPGDGPAMFTPGIAADSNGNAAAVWIAGGSASSTVSPTKVYSLFYGSGAGWQNPASRKLLSADVFPAIGPVRIAMNPSSWGAVAWRRFTPSAPAGSQYNLRGSTLIPGANFLQSSFTNDMNIQGNQTLDADNVQIALNGNTTIISAFAAWTQSSGLAGKHLFLNTNTSNTQWSNSPTSNLDTELFDIPPDSVRLRVEPVLIGRGIITWAQGPLGARNIYARHQSPFGSWNPLVALENQPNDAQFPQIVLAESGSASALVVWQQADASVNANNIYYNRYNGATGAWLPAGVKITTNNPFQAALPNVAALDILGNGMAIWHEQTTAGSMWQIRASKFSIGSASWGPSENLCADLVNPADLSSPAAPGIACRTTFNPTAIWNQNNNSNYTLWSNVFR